MFKPTEIVVHCSATLAEQNINAALIRAWHKGKGWSDIGYHFVIKRDGTIEVGRPLTRMGAGVKGHNNYTFHICLIGGLNAAGKPADSFNKAQFKSLRVLCDGLKFKFKITAVKGHRDYSPDLNKDGVITKNEWLKICPCFEVGEWYYGRITEDKTRKPQVEEKKKDGVEQLKSSTDNKISDSGQTF